MKHVLVVTAPECPCTLAELLAQRLGLSEVGGAATVASGAVYIDGRRCREPTTWLRVNQQIKVYDATAGIRTKVSDPSVVYEDGDLAVLDKPAGLHSIPPRAGGVPTVLDFVERRLGASARLMHRLDHEASGLLLVGRSSRCRQAIDAQLRDHRLQRRYLLLVECWPDLSTRELRGRVAADARGQMRCSDDPRAALAVTRCTLVRTCGVRLFLLQATLVTGRTHQIRVQLAEAGSPLLGDARHGGSAAPRLALHAHALTLQHPDGRQLDLHSPLPRELRVMAGIGAAT